MHCTSDVCSTALLLLGVAAVLAAASTRWRRLTDGQVKSSSIWLNQQPRKFLVCGWQNPGRVMWQNVQRTTRPQESIKAALRISMALLDIMLWTSLAMAAQMAQFKRLDAQGIDFECLSSWFQLPDKVLRSNNTMVLYTVSEHEKAYTIWYTAMTVAPLKRLLLDALCHGQWSNAVSLPRSESWILARCANVAEIWHPETNPFACLDHWGSQRWRRLRCKDLRGSTLQCWAQKKKEVAISGFHCSLEVGEGGNIAVFVLFSVFFVDAAGPTPGAAGLPKLWNLTKNQTECEKCASHLMQLYKHSYLQLYRTAQPNMPIRTAFLLPIYKNAQTQNQAVQLAATTTWRTQSRVDKRNNKISS